MFHQGVLMHHTDRLIRFTIVLIISSVLLIACGSTPPPTPDTVHSQFVQALTANDRQATLDLMVPEARIGVDQFLNRIREIKTGNNLPTRYAGKHGKFVGAEALSVQDEGKGKVGVSVWRWENAVACYQTGLAQTDDGWKVTEWWQATNEQKQQHPQCQEK
jgi:hypothetical protein